MSVYVLVRQMQLVGLIFTGMIRLIVRNTAFLTVTLLLGSSASLSPSLQEEHSHSNCVSVVDTQRETVGVVELGLGSVRSM